MMRECTMDILCNDVAPKRVIVDFITGVWWVAGRLHLASYHNVPRKQTHLGPHIDSTLFLTKVIKPEIGESVIVSTFSKASECFT